MAIDKKLVVCMTNLPEANPIPVKWALAEMGKIPQGIRLPLTWLSDEFHAPLKQAMDQAHNDKLIITSCNPNYDDE